MTFVDGHVIDERFRGIAALAAIFLKLYQERHDGQTLW